MPETAPAQTAFNTQQPSTVTDPGVRGGAPGAGGPLPGLSPAEAAFFAIGKEDFGEAEGVAEIVECDGVGGGEPEGLAKFSDGVVQIAEGLEGVAEVVVCVGVVGLELKGAAEGKGGGFGLAQRMMISTPLPWGGPPRTAGAPGAAMMLAFISARPARSRRTRILTRGPCISYGSTSSQRSPGIEKRCAVPSGPSTR